MGTNKLNEKELFLSFKKKSFFSGKKISLPRERDGDMNNREKCDERQEVKDDNGERDSRGQEAMDGEK